MVIHHLAGIENVSKLPVAGGVILVLISVGLTMIAGLIPAKTAAKTGMWRATDPRIWHNGNSEIMC